MKIKASLPGLILSLLASAGLAQTTPAYGPQSTGVQLPVSPANGGTGLTSLGTGVATALGQNVTGSGGIVLSSGGSLTGAALGTPASGVATNLTGTAAGLTAGNVTTNANLTGPITSTGNATAVAAQTGTGSTFVMQTGAALIGPNLGTPSAAVLTNATGLPISSGVSGLGTGVATALAAGAGASGGFGLSTVYTPLTANYTIQSGDAGKNFQNTGSSNWIVTPTAGDGSFTINQTSTGTASLQYAAENLFTQSTTFENAAWTKNSSSVTSTAVTDPLGGTNARAITTNATLTAYIQYATNIITSRSPYYTWGIWVQGVGASIGQAVRIGNYGNNNRQETQCTLQSTWTFCSVSFNAPATVNNNLYLDFNDARGANVSSGGVVNIYGAWLYTGHLGDKVTTVTTTSSVTAAYDINGAITTSAATPTLNVVEGSTGNFWTYAPSVLALGQDNTFATKVLAPTRGATIVISAYDSVNPANADYQATGNCDDVVISNAITALNGKGGKVLLRDGDYYLCSPIAFTASWVTLTGEARGFWNKFVNAYPSLSLEGTPGGAHLHVNVNGNNAITFNQSNLLYGMTRNNGVAVKDLYIFGNGGTCIYDPNNTDISEISGVAMQGCTTGINVAWDTPFIHDNSIQSIAGDAIDFGFVFGTISSNIMYDIGGAGVNLQHSTGLGGTHVVGNTIGSCSYTNHAGCVIISSGQNTFVGNTITGVAAQGNAINITGTNAGNVVSGNYISIDNTVGVATSANTTGHGIQVQKGSGTGSTGVTITGNTINDTTAGTVTGDCIVLGASGDTTAVNNTVVGNTCAGGKWNSAATQSIVDWSAGNTNIINDNYGDNRKPIVQVAKADLTAQTATIASLVSYTPIATNSYSVTGYLNITACTACVITETVTYQDENGSSRTVTPLNAISATGDNSFDLGEIRANNTAITEVVTLTSGSATFDVGGTIVQQ